MRAILIALSLALLAPTEGLAQTAWKTLSYPELHMTISAPPGATPAVSHQTVPSAGKDVPMTSVALPLPQYGDAALQTLVADFTGLGLTADIDAAARGVVGAAPDATAVQVAPISFQGGQGRDISLKTKGRFFRERLVVVGTRMYQMQAISAVGAAEPLPETERFLGGLTVTP